MDNRIEKINIKSSETEKLNFYLIKKSQKSESFSRVRLSAEILIIFFKKLLDFFKI
jgi:hypothetical protein